MGTQDSLGKQTPPGTQDSLGKQTPPGAQVPPGTQKLPDARHTPSAHAPHAAPSAQERLVRSTQELLWERGYVGTSPKAILERAGVGQGSMYHHFTGKSGLALAAIRRTAEGMKAAAEESLSAPGTAYDRVAGYLLREREVLRGCPVGRMTQDRDVVRSAELRQPLDEMFGWLQGRIGEVLTEGQQRGELPPGLDPSATAATVAAVVQGGYVLARAADDTAPFDTAVQGVLSLLATQVTPSTDTTR